MDKYKYIHFIGIGGISMSGLAEIMLNRNCKVSGSDINDSHLIKHLENLGANIQIGHDKKIITTQDLVVFSSAIKETNPEYTEAKKIGAKILERADFLGELMKEYKHPIAVSGTHGKTTTTGFLTSILIESKMDPTILLGGEYDLIKGNIRIGKGETFLTEACEYKRSFVKFNPQFGIVLNIEEDHLDYYKDLEDIKSAFYEFGSKINENGFLIYNIDCKNSKDLFKSLKCNLITFGLSLNSQVKASNIKYNPYPTYDLFIHNKFISTISLKVPGEHNIYNSLAAIACSYAMDIDNNYFIDGIQNFSGTKRRFEFKGTFNDAIVIDDYAHHPTEILATLRAVKMMKPKRILCVFQPHTYTRTISLIDDFAKSFSNADVVLIVDIYAAREPDLGVIHSRDLVEKLINNNVNAIYLNSFYEASNYFINNAKKGDIILTIGAGDVYLIGESILNIK